MERDGQPETRKTTETSFQVLDAVDSLNGATLSELAEYTGLAISTVHTHLQTLIESEYVVEVDGEYLLGLRLFHLGEKARYRDERYRFARQAAAELADRVSDEVNFSVEEHGQSVVLFDETNTPNQGGFQVGRYFDMHSSASGKAMLAEFDEDRIRSIVDRWDLPRHTEQTITDFDALLEELATISRQGYAVNRQEELEGLRAVGMAVTEPDGSVFGALDISGPSYRLPDPNDVANRLQPFVEDLETKLDADPEEE